MKNKDSITIDGIEYIRKDSLLEDIKHPDNRVITERVKTFADACEVLNNDIILRPDDTKDETAYKKLKVIAEALNEGWKPDWSDSDQPKYYPYFEYKKSISGFGFSGTVYDYWYTYTYVGSRLCFRSSELAKYAGKQFEEIYNEFLSLAGE